ncbi:hypothetical protein AB0E25_26590 [Streptomyces bobili]|uniref:hypothetical protein n=1 Tax=Streptomyces bobili TaxID=67280 RepID=UPI0033CDFBC8
MEGGGVGGLVHAVVERVAAVLDQALAMQRDAGAGTENPFVVRAGQAEADARGWKGLTVAQDGE